MKMSVKEQFNIVAKEYDSRRKLFIPCFNDYYETTTNFIAANMLTPKNILDLGAGTGLLTYFWYQCFPESKYVLVDFAKEMLDIARKRFWKLENVHYEILDYSNALPKGVFDCIVSALSIHHVEYKKKLFENIYDKLPSDGVFVNYDQFSGGSSKMNGWFDSYWEKHLENSRLTIKEIELWKERRKLDRECSVEEEENMLMQCGFKEVKCVYSYQKFSVIVAVK